MQEHVLTLDDVVMQAKVKEPELYELHERVQQIRKQLDQAPNRKEAETELLEQNAATQ